MTIVHLLPSPIVNAENAVFWQSAQAGKLVLKICESCQELHYYPRSLCPHCGGDQTQWIDSAGYGEVYSYTVMRKGVDFPFAMAYVALTEGVTMLTHLTNCDFDSIRIGQRVQVVFQESEDGQMVPLFEPRAD